MKCLVLVLFAMVAVALVVAAPEGGAAVEPPTGTDSDAAAEDGVAILSAARACTNAWCYNTCRSLGYRTGSCASSTRCVCYR